MAGFPGRRRQLALWTSLLLVAAIGLGLVHRSDTAAASCAGPQLSLRQAGRPVTTRRTGEGAAEKLIYRVQLSQRLVIRASNLTFDCMDTGGGGCSGPSPQTTIRPLRDVSIILTQHDQQWTLARIGDAATDLNAEASTLLPPDVAPGAATLRLSALHYSSAVQLRLKIV